MAEHVVDAMRNADAEIAALRRTKPSNAAEARVKSAELLRLQQVLLEASRQVVSANAAKRISNGSNGGGGGGHGQPNWAKVIGEMTAETHIALRREIAALGQDDLPELAKGLRSWLDPILDAFEQRLAQLEATATKYRGIWNDEETYAAGSLVTFQGGMWFCEDSNCGVRPGSGSSSWTLANKSRR